MTKQETHAIELARVLAPLALMLAQNTNLANHMHAVYEELGMACEDLCIELTGRNVAGELCPRSTRLT